MGTQKYIILMWEQKWGGEKYLSTKKMGRPTDSPKTETIKVRLDKDTLNKLDECVKINETNRSEEVRKGIKKHYDDIKK